MTQHETECGVKVCAYVDEGLQTKYYSTAVTASQTVRLIGRSAVVNCRKAKSDRVISSSVILLPYSPKHIQLIIMLSISKLAIIINNILPLLKILVSRGNRRPGTKQSLVHLAFLVILLP